LDTTAVVELENLKVKLGRREILHGITCRLGVSGTGKAVGLLGPNGAGKTTFVRICATQLLPSSGTISVLGYDAIRQAKQVRDLVSIVPQEGRPLRALTPWDHVYNWLRIRGESSDNAKVKAVQILKKLDLYDARNVPAMNLSGGMKQKVLVAMALAPDAQLLFLDEPTIGLDPVSRRQVWSAIKEWKDQDRTILLTTHYMDEAQRLCDRVAIMSAGRVICGGAPAQLISSLAAETIEFDCSLDEEDALLNGFAADASRLRIGQRLMLYLDDSSDLIEHIRHSDRGDRRPIVVRPTNLEDVFLSLTGTSLEANS